MIDYLMYQKLGLASSRTRFEIVPPLVQLGLGALRIPLARRELAVQGVFVKGL